MSHMSQSMKWRLGLVLGTGILGLLFLLPSLVPSGSLPGFLPQKRINLGLDLQGGLHLELKVLTEKAIENTLARYGEQISRGLRDERARVRNVETSARDIRITVRGDDGAEKLEALLKKNYPGLEVKDRAPAEEGHIAFTLALSAAEAANIEQYAIDQGIETIRNRVDQFGVAEPVIISQGRGEILIQLPGLGTLSADKIAGDLRQMVAADGMADALIEATGTEIHVTLPSEAAADSLSSRAVTRFVGLSRERIEPLPGGKSRLVLALASSQRAKKLIGQTAQLELRMLDDTVDPSGSVPPDAELLYGKPTLDPRTGKQTEKPRAYLVKKRVLMTGEMISDARMAVDPQQSQYYVHMEFNSLGASLFGELTTASVGKNMAIVLDGVVQSAPVIREPITGGKASISGSFTRDEARDLSIALRSGSLPAPVAVMHEIEVGATLGEDSIRSGMLSLLVGFLAVSLFMGFYYKWSGALADLMMGLNILLTLATLAVFRATLTMPGIAGIVLTMGMSVDTNVLIFERIREELRLGRTLANAVSTGFGKAFVTIFDAHMTTLIASGILMWQGTGPIRGFAVTLAIGLIWNLFTAVVGTRVAYDLILTRRDIKRLSI